MVCEQNDFCLLCTNHLKYLLLCVYVTLERARLVLDSMHYGAGQMKLCLFEVLYLGTLFLFVL